MTPKSKPRRARMPVSFFLLLVGWEALHAFQPFARQLESCRAIVDLHPGDRLIDDLPVDPFLPQLLFQHALAARPMGQPVLDPELGESLVVQVADVGEFRERRVDCFRLESFAHEASSQLAARLHALLECSHGCCDCPIDGIAGENRRRSVAGRDTRLWPIPDSSRRSRPIPNENSPSRNML